MQSIFSKQVILHKTYEPNDDFKLFLIYALRW